MTLPIVVVGAGAAGAGAGLALREAGAPFLILEAQDRVGGRAHTVMRGGFPLDLGCEWLHHAEKNSWVERFRALGLTLDRREAAWEREAVETTFPPDQQADYHRAFAAMEARVAEAAKAKHDRPAGDLLEPGDRWNPLLNSFSAAYNGAAFRDISVQDYAAYDDGEENWRVPMGYGAAITCAAEGLPVRLSTPVRRIDHGGMVVKLTTTAGEIQAAAVIVTLPTTLLAEGAIAFDPPLPQKQEAAAALPLGHVAKVFVRLDGRESEGVEQVLYTEPLGPEPAALFLRGGDRPVAELFVGGDLATRLEAEGAAAAYAFTVDRLAQGFGSAVRARVSPLAASAWSRDPWAKGAYSYAKVGEHGARRALAEPVDGRLFFAGEAAHPTLFSTAHGAHDTGVAAARAAMAALGL